MPTAKGLMMVFVAVAIAVTLFNPISAAVNDNTGAQTVTNESVTANHGTWVDLTGYDVDENSETVYYENGSDYDVATAGTDYDIRYGSGEIKTNSSGAIADGANLKVTYTYQATNGSQTTVATLVPLFAVLLILGVLAAKIQEYL